MRWPASCRVPKGRSMARENAVTTPGTMKPRIFGRAGQDIASDAAGWRSLSSVSVEGRCRSNNSDMHLTKRDSTQQPQRFWSFPRTAGLQLFDTLKTMGRALPHFGSARRSPGGLRLGGSHAELNGRVQGSEAWTGRPSLNAPILLEQSTNTAQPPSPWQAHRPLTRANERSPLRAPYNAFKA
jgi:hypothetical protein